MRSCYGTDTTLQLAFADKVKELEEEYQDHLNKCEEQSLDRKEQQKYQKLCQEYQQKLWYLYYRVHISPFAFIARPCKKGDSN